MTRGAERADVAVATADLLLTTTRSSRIPVAHYIGECFSPAACPPEDSGTHWDGWSR